MPVDISALSSDNFRPWLNHTFTVILDDGGVYALELFEIKDLGEAPSPQHRRPFSLLFRSARTDAYLPQRVYPLQHPEIGELELFLVPLGPQAGMMVYQAILA